MTVDNDTCMSSYLKSIITRGFVLVILAKDVGASEAQETQPVVDGNKDNLLPRG